jgi:uncharacterized membrane protein YccC
MHNVVSRYSYGVKKFFYSHHFSRGLRNGIGVFLPAFVVTFLTQNKSVALSIATGAICAAVVDIAGPLKHQRNEMLAGVLLGCVTLASTYMAGDHPLMLGGLVLFFTFLLAMMAVYGSKTSTIGFAALFMMIVGIGTPLRGTEAVQAIGLFLVGGFWYMGFSLTVCKVHEWRMAQQALAECIFATADYLYTRAAFYDATGDFDDAFQSMLSKQSVVIEKQRVARDIVLRHADVPKNNKEIMLVNLFINVVDLHESVMSAHTDYELLRRLFTHSDMLIFFHDLILKAVEDLQEIGLCVSTDRVYDGHVHFMAEIRALEYEIELLKRKHFPLQEPEGYAALVSTFRRIWSATRCIERMRHNTDPAYAKTAVERKLRIAFTGFLSHENIRLRRLWDNLRLDAPICRHALRVTAAVGVAYFLGQTLSLTHGTWIMMTVFIIMKPGYSLTQQKNKERLYGTIMGCIVSAIILYLAPSHRVLLGLVFMSMVIGYGLVYLHYQLSVVFTCSFVILLLHYQQPITFALVQERAVDTLIGSLLAILFSRWLPSWEHRSFQRLIFNMLNACEVYARAAMGKLIEEEGQVNYRLARKEVNTHYTHLLDALTRMLREPRSHQWEVSNLHHLVIETHIFISHLAAIYPALEQQEQKVSHPCIQDAVLTILHQLALPRKMSPLRVEELRAWSQKLDRVVQEIEQQVGANEAVKLITHQLKFLLKSGAAISKRVDALMAAMPKQDNTPPVALPLKK